MFPHIFSPEILCKKYIRQRATYHGMSKVAFKIPLLVNRTSFRLKAKLHRGLTHKFGRSLRHKFRPSLYSTCSSIVDSGILELNLIPSTYIEGLSFIFAQLSRHAGSRGVRVSREPDCL